MCTHVSVMIKDAEINLVGLVFVLYIVCLCVLSSQQGV